MFLISQRLYEEYFSLVISRLWDARYTAWGDIKQGPNIGPGLQISQGTTKNKKNLLQSKILTKFKNELKNIKNKFSPTSLPALILENAMSVASSYYGNLEKT